jgi:hypothetical protein
LKDVEIVGSSLAANFTWHKYAVVAVVGHDNSGKEEPWLAMTSNKAPLEFVYEKLPPAIYLEQLLSKKKFKQWKFTDANR